MTMNDFLKDFTKDEIEDYMETIGYNIQYSEQAEALFPDYLIFRNYSHIGEAEYEFFIYDYCDKCEPDYKVKYSYCPIAREIKSTLALRHGTNAVIHITDVKEG